MEQIISRQFAISEGNAEPLPLPDYDTYAICNLRGGIGKSSLCFNLSYLTDNVLMVDTCPQGNLSYFYDNQYFSRNTSTVYDLILPHIMPGLGTAARVAQSISATNEHFKDKNSFFIPSSEMILTSRG